MKKTSIAIIAGGDSSEREISLKGAEFYKSFLNKEKYHLTLVDISKNGWFAYGNDGEKYSIDKNDFSYTVNTAKHYFDMVINIIHGTPGENGLIQAYFELVSIPYLTGGVASSVISFDKEFCKAVVGTYGVKTAKSITIHKGENYPVDEIAELGFPLFVKPNASGSSFGVTKVKCKESIAKAIDHAMSEDSVVLAEKAVNGREISCGVYSIGGEVHLLPHTEIVTKREFFDYEAKYLGESQEITPANFPEIVQNRVNEYSKIVYKALRCHGVVRIDYIVEDQQPYMIEVNNIPGMSAQSIIPQQVAAQGLNISELYDNLINDLLNK